MLRTRCTARLVLICLAALAHAHLAASQTRPPADRTTTRSDNWLVGVDTGAAFMANPEEDCILIRNATRDSALDIQCITDHRMPFWSAGSTKVFAGVITVSGGYLDIGRATLEVVGTGPGSVVAIDGEFGRTRGVTVTAGLRRRFGRAAAFADAGLWRWAATTTARTRVNLGGVSSTSVEVDEDSGWDRVVRAGVEVWLASRVALDGGLRFAWAQSGSADDLGGVDERFTILFVGLKLGL